MLVLGGVCMLAATGSHLADPRTVARAAETPAAVGIVTRVPDAAVIPARVADEMRAASQGAPLRVLVLAAVLALLIGLPAVLRRHTSPANGDDQPLRTRRYTIALRAPPLQFA